MLGTVKSVQILPTKSCENSHLKTRISAQKIRHSHVKYVFEKVRKIRKITRKIRI